MNAKTTMKMTAVMSVDVTGLKGRELDPGGLDRMSYRKLSCPSADIHDALLFPCSRFQMSSIVLANT